MQKYEWLNINCILKEVNAHMVEHGFMLIKAGLASETTCDAESFWLIDMAGEIILKNVDLAEFSEGYNLLKSQETGGVETFIANTCDGLLLKVYPDFFTCNEGSADYM